MVDLKKGKLIITVAAFIGSLTIAFSAGRLWEEWTQARAGLYRDVQTLQDDVSIIIKYLATPTEKNNAGPPTRPAPPPARRLPAGPGCVCVAQPGSGAGGPSGGDAPGGGLRNPDLR
jgi:hypothetical protein